MRPFRISQTYQKLQHFGETADDDKNGEKNQFHDFSFKKLFLSILKQRLVKKVIKKSLLFHFYEDTEK